MVRRIEEMIRKITFRAHAIEVVPQEWFSLWSTIQKEGMALTPDIHVWHHNDIPDLATLRELKLFVSDHAKSAQRSEIKERYDGWQSRFADDWREKT